MFLVTRLTTKPPTPPIITKSIPEFVSRGHGMLVKVYKKLSVAQSVSIQHKVCGRIKEYDVNRGQIAVFDVNVE